MNRPEHAQPAIEPSLEPDEGWHCSHLFYRFDRGVLAALAPTQIKEGREALLATLNPAAENAILLLGGPEALSQLEMIKIFEQIGRQPFEVQKVPEEALAEQLKTATDPMQQSFIGLMQGYAKGDPVDMEKTLKTFPLRLTSVKEYAERLLVSA